jgi:membrane protease YdiL (CAAX protease family)
VTTLQTSRPDRPVQPPADRRTTYREIGVFLGTTALLTAISTTVALAEGVDVRHIEDATLLGQTAMYLQATFPLLAAVAARLVVGGGLRGAGWGFRRTSWATIGGAWALGVGTVLAGAALVFGLGLAGLGDVDASLLLGPTVLIAPYVVLALAEDLGWRGLLVVRLAEVAGPRTVVLVGGLAWSAFHWPLMLLLGGTPAGASGWYAVAMFTVGIVALGAVLASMQLRWGIWPGVVMHAAVNATMYHLVDPLTVEQAHSGWFVSETGLVAATVDVAVALVWLRRFPLVRRADGGTTVR